MDGLMDGWMELSIKPGFNFFHSRVLPWARGGAAGYGTALQAGS